MGFDWTQNNAKRRFECFTSRPCVWQPICEQLRVLHEKVDSLKLTPTGAHGIDRRQTNVPPSLAVTKFVFVRRGAKKPLETPYVGPYEVIPRHDK